MAEAIDRLPPEFQRLLDQTPVVVSHLGRENRAYGHYFGDTVARDDYPDRIVLYQDTLERDFGHDPELLRAQVERTLRHELAHHLGWHEPGVRELGPLGLPPRGAAAWRGDRAAEGARLEIVWAGQTASWVRIPPSPP